jgi:lysophospholipase L1-like esterase
MIDCMVIGDSIAVGTAMYRPECVSYSKGGWNSWQWNKNYLTKDLSAKTVIISLGSNDHKGVKTRKELETMRELVKGSRVFWILPAGNLKAGGVDIKDIQEIVRDIANKKGDIVLPISNLQPDGIHPTGKGYKILAEQTK